MTTLLDLGPRDAGTVPPEIDVEFKEGTTLHEIAACWQTCTVNSADDAI